MNKTTRDTFDFKITPAANSSKKETPEACCHELAARLSYNRKTSVFSQGLSLLLSHLLY